MLSKHFLEHFLEHTLEHFQNSKKWFQNSKNALKNALKCLESILEHFCSMDLFVEIFKSKIAKFGKSPNIFELWTVRCGGHCFVWNSLMIVKHCFNASSQMSNVLAWNLQHFGYKNPPCSFCAESTIQNHIIFQKGILIILDLGI